MAAFLAGLGRALGDAGAGVAAGQTQGAQLGPQIQGQQLQNKMLGIDADVQQMLLDKVKSGELPLAALLDPGGYFKAITGDMIARRNNVEQGNQWLLDADRTTDKTRAAALRSAAFDLMGPNGTGTLSDPNQVARIWGLSLTDIDELIKYGRYNAEMNPKPSIQQTMGPGGSTVLSTVTFKRNPDGTFTVTPNYIMPPGVPSSAGVPNAGMPTMGAPAEAPPEGAPGAGVPPPGFGGPPGPPAGGVPPITESDRDEVIREANANMKAKGIPPNEIARVDEALGETAATPFPSPSGGVAPTASRVDPPPPELSMHGAAPPPIPRAYGGNGGYPRPFLTPKPTTQDALALNQLAAVLHQTELLYRAIRAVPANERRGPWMAKWDLLKLYGGITSGRTIDDLVSQIGADKASLISGFQAAGKTRAFAAIKLVQDHYPQLKDEDALLLHKLEQLLRPDGYLTFAYNSIIYGPSAATAMNPIHEPLVAPPGAVYDATRHWQWKNGAKFIYLDGVVYRQDIDGYWVEATPSASR